MTDGKRKWKKLFCIFIFYSNQQRNVISNFDCFIFNHESILKIAIIENNIQVFGKHKTEPQIMRTKRKQSNNGRVECDYAPNVHNKYAHKLILYGFIDYSLICIRGEQKN